MSLAILIPKWSTLRTWSNNSVIRSSLYWLAIVPIAVSALKNVPSEVSIPLHEPIEVSLQLPFSWRLLWAAGLAGFLAQLLILLACPAPIRHYSRFSELRDAGLDRDYLIDQLIKSTAIESHIPRFLSAATASDILYPVLSVVADYMEIFDDQGGVKATIPFSENPSEAINDSLKHLLTPSVVKDELYRGLNYRGYKTIEAFDRAERRLLGSFFSYVGITLLPVRSICTLLLLIATLFYAFVFSQGVISVAEYLRS